MPNTDSSGDKRDQNSGQLRHWSDYSTLHSLSWFKRWKIKPTANCFCYFARQWWISLNLNIHWIFNLLGYMSTLLHDGTLGRRTCLCHFSLSPALPESGPEAVLVNVQWQIVNIGENHHDKDKKCPEAKAWAGTRFQLLRAGAERPSEDAGGVNAWTAAVKHTHFANSYFFFPSTLSKLPG